MGDKLADANLSSTEIASTGKEFASLGYTVNLISDRNTLLKDIAELESIENESGSER